MVVEGYTDVLALHGAGMEESVGIMGTALTQEQLAELARAVGGDGTVLLALDADSSGRQAMLRAARIAEERDIRLRVVEMPEGKDPADLVMADGSGGADGRGSAMQSLCLSLRSGGRLPMATSRAPKAGTEYSWPHGHS